MTDFLSELVKPIFDVLFAIINALVSMFLFPLINGLNLILSSIWEDWDVFILDLLNMIDYVLEEVVLPTSVWVVNLIPPYTFGVCSIFMLVCIGLVAYEYTIGIVIKVLKLVKNTIPMA